MKTKSRRARDFTLLLAAALGLAGQTAAQADLVLFNSNPSSAAYRDVRNSLFDVYGIPQSVSSNGVGSVENPYGVFKVRGTGPQIVPVAFIFDDGAYQFEFGYFEFTASLAAMPVTTVAEKEAFAKAALATAATIFIDRNASYTPPPGAKKVATDPDDPYTPAPNDPIRDASPYNISNNRVNLTLTGGRNYVFFIIPNNRLSNFNADAAADTNGDGSFFETFSLTGSSANAWPLFTYSAANPGPGLGGAGDGYDQSFVFFSTTRNAFTPIPNQRASLVTFEDILRRSDQPFPSDNDFNDLHFVIGNVDPVPEGSTMFAGASVLAALAAARLAKSRRRHISGAFALPPR